MPAIIIPKETLTPYRRWEAVDFSEEKKAAERARETPPDTDPPEDAQGANPPPPGNAESQGSQDAPPSDQASASSDASDAANSSDSSNSPNSPDSSDAPTEKAPEVTSEEVHVALPTAADIERTYAEAREQGFAAGHEEGRAAAHEEGYTAGHDEGFAAGHDEGIAPAKLVSAQIDVLLKGVQTALSELDQRVADQLLATSLKVAEQVLRQTLRVKPEYLLSVVAEAVALLEPQLDAPTLIVHPDDAKMLREHSDEMPECKEWRIVENASITPGGCRVELNAAEADATLETRWRRVVESIGISEEWLDGKP
ncbi:MAG: flagellar assembly protein FliH [Candidatus Accumulibacter sp.]|jgi:flagellar assembly protein FliH|nr:flagellar assembly protein FliH [Accumulibacter sp.]